MPFIANSFLQLRGLYPLLRRQRAEQSRGMERVHCNVQLFDVGLTVHTVALVITDIALFIALALEGCAVIAGVALHLGRLTTTAEAGVHQLAGFKCKVTTFVIFSSSSRSKWVELVNLVNSNRSLLM